ncbi:regulator of nonsense transcripts 3B [Solea senegalensis]|uniref:Regulator of nonsense transcripts 3B n=1 Tax=Solea senegalensis TaxID=28829 RepID=A0AAV6SP51_SOLSE|nr:regulator of nonsense transcripts 3B [Solea senegalensis]KAG7518638.1 regulator of nonsense transcripts 3B [Solea senegalensis]
MKEDKENTRPKDKRVDLRSEDGEKMERSKEKKEAMTKIVIRRLPPSLTKDELEEQLQPLPELDYMEFFSNDTSLYPHLFARAYINFKNQDDIVLFRDRFDGYVFIDSRGQEYPAIVEFAPFQKTAKKRSKKKDAKCGTISDDPDYKKFLEYYNGDEEKLTSTPETLLEEIEAKSKELVAKKTTPLLDFLKNKQRIKEEKKEERRRRELERKRLRDEERRKWREEERRKRKEADKMKRLEKPLEKDKDQVKEEPKIKLLKKPDRGDDADSEKPKEKAKKTEKHSKDDRPLGSTDHKRRQHIDNKEDRGRKVDDDGRKEFRERDEREKERRQKEKERIRRQDEDRRRRRERHDGENSNRKREDEVKREKEHEKKKVENSGESGHLERPEKFAKDNKKEESSKRERLRNKDRPAIQLYQPGTRSRNRTTGGGGTESNSADRKPDPETKKAGDKGDD